MRHLVPTFPLAGFLCKPRFVRLLEFFRDLFGEVLDIELSELFKRARHADKAHEHLAANLDLKRALARPLLLRVKCQLYIWLQALHRLF